MATTKKNSAGEDQPVDEKQRYPKGHVHDERGGKYTFEFQEDNETRRLPERKRLVEIALFANHGIVFKMERFLCTELGYGKKPTCRQF